MRGFLSSQAPPSTSTLRATLPSQKHAYVVTKKTLSWIFKHSERRYRYILWRFPMRSCTQIHSLAYGLRLNSRSRTSVNISAFLIHLPECEASRFTISLDLSFYQALKEFCWAIQLKCTALLSLLTENGDAYVMVIDDNIKRKRRRQPLTFARWRSRKLIKRTATYVLRSDYSINMSLIYRLSRQ